MGNEVMQKYEAFANDYNAGMARVDLCLKHGVPDAKYDAFLQFLKRKGFQLAERQEEPAPAGPVAGPEYQIFGDDMQFIVVTLNPGESIISEAGAMMYMEPAIAMDTTLGDGGSAGQGVMSKLMGAGKRALTGESLFLTTFSNAGAAKQRVALAPPHPGKILAVNLSEMGGEILCQKDAFLASTLGVSLSLAFQQKLGAALFGGEGFILQRLSGEGTAFIHAGGMILSTDLQQGQTLKLDTGCVVAFSPSMSYDIQYVGNVKSALFGGEGVFFANISGPGRLWIQSMPFSKLAGKIVSRGGGGKKATLSIGNLIGGGD